MAYNLLRLSKCISVYMLFLSHSLFSQIISSHPIAGFLGEKVGSCMLSRCGDDTYYDNGGVGANYSNNINGVYRTFCPSIAGNCMKATFTTFQTEPTNDYMQIFNGPSNLFPLHTGAPNSATSTAGVLGISGTPTVPFSVESSHRSGCLSFGFTSNSTTVSTGWAATLTCVPCAGGPTGSASDCINAIAICTGGQYAAAEGPGLYGEGCPGASCPVGGKKQASWFKFKVASAGFLRFNITPELETDDYDFALYGPGIPCSLLTAPLKCSDAYAPGAATGLANLVLPTSLEQYDGASMVNELWVTSGLTYYLMVDKSTPGNGGFNIEFTGSAVLDCIILPAGLTLFDAEYHPDSDEIALTWVSDSERDLSHYTVERSVDGKEYKAIGNVTAVGNTTQESQYWVVDDQPERGYNYYRLKMVDFNGDEQYSDIKYVNVLDPKYDHLTVFPNPTSGKTEFIFNAYTADWTSIQLVDAAGKILLKDEVWGNKGGNRFELDLSEQTAGIYILHVTTKQSSYQTRIIRD